MFCTSTSPLRHAHVAALLVSSMLSAGCHRTVLVPTSALPRIIAAQAEGGPELEIIDVNGKKQTIHAPVEAIKLVPVHAGEVFMKPRDVEWAIPVAPDVRWARENEGWDRAEVTVNRPFAARADSDAVRLEQLPSEGVGPRRILVPAQYVGAVEVREFDQAGTAAATVGIVLGAAALVVGIVALSSSLEGIGPMLSY